MTDELKECPWCGEMPGIEKSKDSDMSFPNYSVECNSKDCKINPATWGIEDVEQAIKQWNHRDERVATNGTAIDE